MKIAVLYRSKYGCTKKYAEWIAEELGAELIERKAMKAEQMAAYDLIIYGGGIYGNGISGIDLVAKNPCYNLVLFTVGATDLTTSEYQRIMNKNLPIDLQVETPAFHLQGQVNYRKLSLPQRISLALRKKSAAAKIEAPPIKREAITPLVSFVRHLDCA